MRAMCRPPLASRLASLALVAFSAVACSKKDPPPTPPAALEGAAQLTVSSPSFVANGPIPSKYTCEGEDTSPALAWGEVPAATKSIAVIVDDPDAPDPAAPKQVFVHWVLYDVAPSATEIREGAMNAAGVQEGARDGKSDFGRTGYGGPCPPKGRHRYFFKVYALDVALPDLGQPTKAELERAMSGHVLARGELIGTYEKGQK